jgi:iron complex transport system substrate-binding protein
LNIVTLLPSATEIVCALGLEKHLVGVSHSCGYPPGVKNLPSMTSTSVPYTEPSDVIDSYVRDHLTGNEALYELDLSALESARPDFIVSQALCDVCAVSTGDVAVALDALSSRPQIIDLEPNTLDEVFADCKRVGEALGFESATRDLFNQLNARRTTVSARSAAIPINERPRVAYLEWLLPPFNGGHWNPELVELAGGIDVLGAHGKPSSTITWDQVIESKPDVLFIACCGFSSERALEDVIELQTGNEWQQMQAIVNARVLLADGNDFFSRPGPRLVDGLEIMAHALHPDVHPVSPYGSCITVR